MPITFDGKNALDMKCKKCGKPIAKKVGTTTTMENFTNINNEIWHDECFKSQKGT